MGTEDGRFNLVPQMSFNSLNWFVPKQKRDIKFPF